MNRSSVHLTRIITLTMLAVLGRMALLAVPGVSLSFLVIAIAAIAFGPRVGATVALFARLTSDILVSGLNPIFIPMCLVEATLACAVGLFASFVDVGQRSDRGPWWPRLFLANLAVVYTIAFSMLSDVVTWLFYSWVLPLPDAANHALLGVLLVQGIVFNVPSIVFNAVLFPLTIPPVLSGLREAGLLPEPRTAPTDETTADRGFHGVP